MTERDSACAALLDCLTPKEREVLDKVAEHHTTKEIARDLALAPNTVDMRLRSARTKLGARDRNDLSRIYLGLLETCGKTTCGFSVMSSTADTPLPAAPEPSRSAQFVFHDAGALPRSAPWETFEQEAFPEELDRRFGRWWRGAAIVAGALALAVLALILLSIASGLGMLI
jgi:DNA-binding CsgD family transcriptional regulator